MLIHPADPNHPLVEPSDLDSPDAPPLPAVLAPYEGPLRQTLDWARDYLCNPHPELGRKGDVCPFVGTSIKRSTFYMTVWPGVPSDRAEVKAVLQRFREWFSELEPKEGTAAQFKTMLVIFPDLPDDVIPRVIDATQDELKGEYVEVGLMLGEFHAGPPDKAGLWNTDFRPLTSPVPLLAIRHMVPTDFPFLRDERDYVAAYLRQFGHRVPSFLQAEVAATVTRHALGGPVDDVALDDPALVDPAVTEAVVTEAATPSAVAVGLAVGMAVEIPAQMPPNAAVGLAVTRMAELADDLAACPVTGDAAACPVDHTAEAATAEVPGPVR